MDISVILPYNVNRGFLEKSIESYHSQIFSGTSELIIEHSDGSSVYNVNEGLKKAKGKYIKILHEDDMLTPDCLQALFDKAETGCDLVCSNAFNLKSDETEKIESKIGLTVGNMAEDYGIHGGTVLYRKSALEAVGGFNDKLKYGEEFELHLRMAAAGCVFSYTNHYTYYYRIHDRQKSMQGGFTDEKAYLQRKRYILNEIVFKYADNRQLINVK